MSDWFAAEKSTKDRIREPGRTLTDEEITVDVDHPPVETLGTDFSSKIYSLAKRTSANLVSKTNNSKITPEYVLTKSMVWHWKRDLATIFSGELKMFTKYATMGCFTPKYPELDQQVKWFSGSITFVIRNLESIFCTVKWGRFSVYVKQRLRLVRNALLSWWFCNMPQKWHCNYTIYGYLTLTLRLLFHFYQLLLGVDWCFSLKPKKSQMILPLKPSMDGMRNGSDTTWSAYKQKQPLAQWLPADETTMHLKLPSNQTLEFNGSQ